ncbi:hypothetical protein ZTR_00358 [Talaromyces verruculosus]|nr:hypothetical protein ZTR_00358 [Talaromyces verruculosus]
MADIDETSQVEAASQSHDNEKPSDVKASENIASVASQGAEISPPQPQAQPVHVQQSPPQQQQQPQIISSAQINASISGNVSPQLFQVQQQPGQAPQTMALINGQLVPVSTTPLPVPVSGSVPKPVVLPQVQIQVQGPAAVNMQASIAQKQPTTEISTSTSTPQKTNVSENKPEKIELVSSAPAPPRTSTAQAQANNDAIPASRKTRDRGCGCGFWAAIMRPFQQEPRGRRNGDDNKNDRDNNQTTTANNDNQDDATANQSLGTTAVNMAINPVPAPTPAAQGDPIQTSQGIGATDVGQNNNGTFYPLGTNDINAVNAMNSQDMYATPTNMVTPDTVSPYQYSVPVQQPPSFFDPSQAVPAPGSGQATDQVAADGTIVGNSNIDGEGEEELVDDGYDDGMDDDY